MSDAKVTEQPVAYAEYPDYLDENYCVQILFICVLHHLKLVSDGQLTVAKNELPPMRRYKIKGSW